MELENNLIQMLADETAAKRAKENEPLVPPKPAALEEPLDDVQLWLKSIAPSLRKLKEEEFEYFKLEVQQKLTDLRFKRAVHDPQLMSESVSREARIGFHPVQTYTRPGSEMRPISAASGSFQQMMGSHDMGVGMGGTAYPYASNMQQINNESSSNGVVNNNNNGSTYTMLQ